MDRARCGGSDEKISHAPGTNQIAGFEFCQLTSWKKDHQWELNTYRLIELLMCMKQKRNPYMGMSLIFKAMNV